MAAARAMVAGCVSRLPQCVGSAVVRGSGRQALASTSSLSMRAAPLRQSALQRATVQQSRNLQGCRVVSAEYTTAEEGAPDSLEYRVFFSDKSGKTVSPWHDIPLHAGDGLFNFIVEIPKETKAKMEVATEEPNTPIKQDTKKGKLRFYPYNINWNYGLLPQTWEDPSHSNSDVENAFGDNDPVDVVEIGERQAKLGEVLKVKPLAVLPMIDEGELDWKVVAISVDDPKADLVNNVADVEKHFPGTLTAIRDWFRDYKIPDGKPANKFGLGDKAADKEYALKVIAETNEAWAKLVKRTPPYRYSQSLSPRPTSRGQSKSRTPPSWRDTSDVKEEQVEQFDGLEGVQAVLGRRLDSLVNEFALVKDELALVEDIFLAQENELALVKDISLALSENHLLILAGEVIAWIAGVHSESEPVQQCPVVNTKSYKFFVTNSGMASQFATNAGLAYKGAFLPLVKRVLEMQHSTVHFKTAGALERAVMEGLQMTKLDRAYFLAEIPDQVFVLEHFDALRKSFGTF